jgi:signal peptidase I
MRRTYATRPEVLGPAPEPARSKKAEKDREKEKPKEGHRETVEALVVAFILALLVRGFEAEAFVIPTGSMAPTLMGRHKEVTCPQCGYVYTVNASEEDEGGRGLPRLRDSDSRPRVVAGTCVNCRFQAKLDEAPTFNGDRILVMKFPYDLPFLPGASGPQRWDVVVFRYPEEPEVSYIKRLVGLPGEVLRVYFGDIYIKRPGERDFRLARKPLRHQSAMQMMVYDDSHRPAALADRPEWRRWSSGSDPAWREESPGGSAAPGTYVVEASPAQSAELRYHHLVPDPEQWQTIVEGETPPRPPRASLVTDFYSYNTNLTGESRGWDGETLKQHWVGDLTLSARLEVRKPGGIVRLDLVEGGVSNRCEIDLASGVATLFHGDNPLGRRVTKINGPGRYDVTFANVDDRLTLLVDDRPLFDDGLTYDDGDPTHHPAPTEADLAPAGVTAVGASVAVSGLVLKRDIYYTQYPGRSDYASAWDHPSPTTAVEMLDLLSDPARFPELGNLKWQDYPIGQDRYMMLGDNSPRSKDGRGWSNADRLDPNRPGTGWDASDRAYWEVPRALLTGKAFFVYWPHGKPFGPDLHLTRDIRVPFRPYVERMKWIR